MRMTPLWKMRWGVSFTRRHAPCCHFVGLPPGATGVLVLVRYATIYGMVRYGMVWHGFLQLRDAGTSVGACDSAGVLSRIRPSHSEFVVPRECRANFLSDEVLRPREC